MEYYAHTYGEIKEPLIHHLLRTADLAESFGNEFQCGKIMRQIGLLHDIGKHSSAFQNVLKGKETHIDHAIVGGNVYAEIGPQYNADRFLQMIISNVITSHHTDLNGEFREKMFRQWLSDMDIEECRQLITANQKRHALYQDIHHTEYEDIKQFCMDNNLLMNLNQTDYPNVNKTNHAELMLFIRLLYSCLIDADYSATIELENTQYLTESTGEELRPQELLNKLDLYRQTLVQNARPSIMNTLRNQVYHDAANAGKTCIPQLYTLTAPTGTGKTLALITFALESAKRNHQNRVFVILPYLSIIEQNVAIYKAIFGDNIVIEDDSSIYVKDDDGATLNNKLYAERWTAPIIVTTSVRFFSTLMTAHASTARRLHNVVNSVVVFDEVQTLPYNLLDITMQTLKALTNYNTTILLSTGTQPEYGMRQYMHVETEEVINDKEALYKQYEQAKNTSVEFLRNVFTYDELAAHYHAHCNTPINQVCFIFNTTKKARRMKAALIQQGVSPADIFILSTDLCPQHKKDVIEEIIRRINHQQAFYLCSTQCIEAGVDLDIPVIYREYAPLTSVIQSAGRCNRNGKGAGYFFIFQLEDTNTRNGSPNDIYRHEMEITYSVSDGHTNLYDKQLSYEYYKYLFEGDGIEHGDKPGITEACSRISMDDLDNEYQLIEEEAQVHILVPYHNTINEFNDMKCRLEESDYHTTFKELRKCHAFTVSKYMSRKMAALLTNCHPIFIHGQEETMWYIADIFEDQIYDQRDGLIIKVPENTDFI